MAPRPTDDKPLLALVVVIFTVESGALQVLLIRRSAPPFQGLWALPGGVFSGEARPFDGLRAQPGDLVQVLIERTSPWSLQGRLAGAATPRKAGGEPASLSTRLTGPANPLNQRRASIRGRSRAEKARPSCPPAGGGLAQASLKAGLQRDRDLVHHGTSSG